MSCPDQHIWYLMLQYPLYIVMVFNEWKQGIHVAFTIQGKSRGVDIVPRLKKLNAKCQVVMPDWKPNAFVVDNDQAKLNAIRYVHPVQISLAIT